MHILACVMQSNPEAAMEIWIASSQELLAMTICHTYHPRPEEPRACAASRRMAASARGPSFEARRKRRRAPLATTANPLRGDDGGAWRQAFKTNGTRLVEPRHRRAAP